MQAVAFSTCQLENELVFEKASSFSIQLTDEAEETRTSSDAFEHRAEIDHRVETIKPAFAGLKVILPSAADVIGVDEVCSFLNANRLCFESCYFFCRKNAADNDETVSLILVDNRFVQAQTGSGIPH